MNATKRRIADVAITWLLFIVAVWILFEEGITTVAGGLLVTAALLLGTGAVLKTRTEGSTVGKWSERLGTVFLAVYFIFFAG